jgi:hypothetical protein
LPVSRLPFLAYILTVSCEGKLPWGIMYMTD